MAHLRGQEPGGRAQRRVADRVREAVVDGLEVIEVDHRDRERTAVPQRQCELVGEPLVEAAPVGEAGERVLVGLLLELVEEHRLLQVRLGQRHVEGVEVRVRARQCRLSPAFQLGLAPRGLELELDRQRAQLVARGLGLHFAFERVEPAEVPQRGDVVAGRLVVVGERRVALALGGLQAVALAVGQRGGQPRQRVAVAPLREVQPAERQAGVRDAEAVAGGLRLVERGAQRALRAGGVALLLEHQAQVVERGRLLQRQAQLDEQLVRLGERRVRLCVLAEVLEVDADVVERLAALDGVLGPRGERQAAPVVVEAGARVVGARVDDADRAQRGGLAAAVAGALVQRQRAELEVERAREVAQRVVDEADRAQRPRDRAVVAGRLERAQRLVEERQRAAVLQQEVRAAAGDEERLGVRRSVGQRLRERRRLLRQRRRAVRVDAGHRVGQREQERQALARRLDGVELRRQLLDRGRPVRPVTHARPRPGSRRTWRRRPGRSAPAT